MKRAQTLGLRISDLSLIKLYTYILHMYDLDLNEKIFVYGILNEFHNTFINWENAAMYQD